MKILAIAFVYNERPFLPYALDWYKKQGCEIYVIDNMSDDGTWEYLQEKGIPSHQFDTAGAFHLESLQKEMIKKIHEIKPDWFLWFAPDLFHVYDKTIRETIEEVKGLGYNQIQSPCYCLKNTGEEYGLPLYQHYKYAYVNSRTLLSSAYDELLGLYGDVIFIPLASPTFRGVILEYGGCKLKEIQETKLERRKLAWKKGTPRSHGKHYVEAKNHGWVYKKKGLTDIWKDDVTIKAVRKLTKEVSI